MVLWVKGKLRQYTLFYNLYVGYIDLKRKVYLNKWHLKLGKKFSKLIYKPTLSYIEIDLVAHCNLRCKGCSHFSPLVNQWFADFREFEKDLQRLRSMFHNIESIRLLGGEPLLHPEIIKFIYTTRKIFKNARISIATNGALLFSMKNDFWEACRKNQIKLNMSVYPPFFNTEERILKWVQSQGVIIYSDKHEKFRAILNLNGDSDPLKAFKFCRSVVFVPYLYKGAVYICSRPVVIRYFNERFNHNIPCSSGIDIYNPDINGWDVLISILKPVETCRYCITYKQKFAWDESTFSANEWHFDV